ncbi:unnamed protein product [Protopolystoma xenopodis]|uniref:Uncharacterized protein n=1 Tax=Protopolystoma xenopodis TaxID=117903 RepID=A0A3S5CKX4_9PLAT|nr:unnamed protein product [Protopolystoma xenopodis]
MLTPPRPRPRLEPSVSLRTESRPTSNSPFLSTVGALLAKPRRGQARPRTKVENVTGRLGQLAFSPSPMHTHKTWHRRPPTPLPNLAPLPSESTRLPKCPRLPS